MVNTFFALKYHQIIVQFKLLIWLFIFTDKRIFLEQILMFSKAKHLYAAIIFSLTLVLHNL